MEPGVVNLIASTSEFPALGHYIAHAWCYNFSIEALSSFLHAHAPSSQPCLIFYE